MTPVADHDRDGRVDGYIESFPEPARAVLSEMRMVLHQAVPGAGETISYEIPTLTLDGRSLVYFAGWKRHVSVYPVPAGDDAFEAAIAPYRSGRGTLRFPLAEAIPYDLVTELARLLAADRPGTAG